MVARRCQFILSRIDARNGALGIVPPELDEAIVTPDFPVFNILQTRMLPAYLGWMCRTASFVEECRRASEGTTNRVRLQEDKFLAREISLPQSGSSERWWRGLRNSTIKFRKHRRFAKSRSLELKPCFFLHNHH